MPRRVRIAAVVTSFLIMSGCSTSGVPAESAPPPTPASSDYVDALEHTRSLGTASVTIVIDPTRLGQGPLSGTGAVAFYDGHGDLAWTRPDGSVVRERSNSRGVFVQDEPPDGPWRRATATPPTVLLTDPLRGLGQVVSPQLLGSDIVDGESTERWSGTMHATSEQLDLLALGPAERAALPADPSELAVRVTAWIDDAGRLHRVDRELVAPGTGDPTALARVSTRISDFSRVIDLSTPPGLDD